MSQRIPKKCYGNIEGENVEFNIVQESKYSWYAYGDYNGKSIEAKGSSMSQAKEKWEYKAILLNDY